MITPSKTKSHFEQLLSEIYARRPHANSQQVCVDCLNPRSNKNKFECKNCGCADLSVLDHQNFHVKYSPVCNV